jgi:glutamyl-tRNA synthetase
VPDEVVSFLDGNWGAYQENLARDCGDFLVRRSDGVCAYQLAVTVDDGLMGITRVVRGRDLLSSTPRQIWLHRALGFPPPRYFHTPLLLASDGRRLSKRERDLDMGALRERFTPEELVGRLAALAGLQETPRPVAAMDLVKGFSWEKVQKKDSFPPPDWFGYN